MEIWTTVVGEMLVVKIEPTNRHDIHAVAIYRDAEIVGHVPYNLAPRMSAFLMRENKVFAEITGAKGTGELAMVWKSHVSTVYMDLTFMLTK